MVTHNNDLAFAIYKNGEILYYPGLHEPVQTMDSALHKRSVEASKIFIDRGVGIANNVTC